MAALGQVMELLERAFDSAFTATDGIKRLRERILTLAMQGKLVPQDANDPPARELLADIQVETMRLVKLGNIKQPKPLPPVAADEMPYALPQGWQWVRLGHITTKLTDGSHNPPRDAGSGFPMLSSQNVNYGKVDFSNPSRYVSDADFVSENKRTSAAPGDVLLTIVASLGRPAVVPENAPKFALQRSVAVIRSPISPLFLCQLLGAPVCTNYYDQHAKGTAQKGIYLGKLSEMPIPLPPLPEQHRIVARLERLMARCDAVEKLRAQRERARMAVHGVALKSLLATDGKQGSAWRFLSQNFGELYTVRENVAELRKAILQLAVMGKLAVHDSNDPPASELLRKIEAENEQLIDRGEIKPRKPPTPIRTEEIPYTLPRGWEWARFDQLINQEYPISYVLVPGPDVEDGVPFVRIEDLNIKKPKAQPRKRISLEIAKDYERTKLVGGEILMGVVGSIGKLGVAPPTWKGAYIARAVCRIAPSKLISKQYLLWILQGELMQASFRGDTRTLAQPTLNIGLIRSSLTPLPPLPEQHRIVAKIDQLMDLCDSLTQKIDDAERKQTELLNALMSQDSICA